MDDFPVRIAELLESVAKKVRSMTIDRIAGWTKWAAAGVVLFALVSILVVFLLIGMFRLLGELIDVEWAYAIVGGLFVVLGMFLWSKRRPKTLSKD